MAEANQSDITALTVQLVSAFVSNNSVASDSLADLIKTTRAALTENPAAAAEEPAKPIFTPAVSVRKSLSSPDHIISLIDGKPYKTLKRHLAANDLTPEQYRERYNLPKTYPLVAQSYSESRRAVAEKIGLGKKPVAAAKPAEAIAAAALKAKAAVAPKAPKKVASVPAEKPAKADAVPAAKAAAKPAPAAMKKAGKAKDSAPKAAPIISNRLTSASAAPATAKGEARKRLGIAGPKADKADAKVEPAAKKAGAAPKTKSASKPKTLKAALEAAGSHLGTDAKMAQPAPVKA